jgi:hypothetical protein
MKLWKLVGMAGVAGVAATGVAVTRAERRRQSYTPDEVRGRLRARLTDADGEAVADPSADGVGTSAHLVVGTNGTAQGRAVPPPRS